MGRIEVHPGSFRKSGKIIDLQHTENGRVRKLLKTKNTGSGELRDTSGEFRVGDEEGGYTPRQQCKSMKGKELREEQQGKLLKTKVQE